MTNILNNKYFLYFFYPGLTFVSFIATTVVLSIKIDSTCESSDTGPRVWLLVYAICCVPGFFLSSIGVSKVNGSDSGPVAGIVYTAFLIFIVLTFVWNIVGYGILFGSYKCLDDPLGIMMIINLVYQSLMWIISLIRLLSKYIDF